MVKDDEIILTPKQDECVRFTPEKDMVVKGIAGSGKSLVIVRRAFSILKRTKIKNPKIVILTFNKALSTSIREVCNSKSEYSDSITVMTVDKLLRDIYKNCYGGDSVQYLTAKDSPYERILSDILEKARNAMPEGNRFLNDNMRAWLFDEISWMRQRDFFSNDMDKYVSCKRTGRGISVRPTQKDRKIIFRIYYLFYAKVVERHLHEAEHTYALMAANPQFIDDENKFDYVLVDECQDLSLTKLKVLKNLARRSITLAGDFAQKIYSSAGYTWREIGIDIRGNASKSLNGTYRNTYEIFMLAESLKGKSGMLKDVEDELPDPDMPNRHGNKPVIHCTGSNSEAEKEIIKKIKDIIQARPDDTIGIILPFKKEPEQWCYKLKRVGIKADYIKNDSEFSILSPGVKVSTYHSAKGMEFDNVILANVNTDHLPMKMNADLDEDQKKDKMDEGRNILYVGMTRARENLHIYCTRGTNSQPSLLLDELDKQYYESDGF